MEKPRVSDSLRERSKLKRTEQNSLQHLHILLTKSNPKFEEIQCTDKNTGLPSDFKIIPKSGKQNRRDEPDNERLHSSKKDKKFPDQTHGKS